MSPAFNASPDQLTLALSKGRIFETLPLLAAAGIR
jgi:ATP phosphoribosyltransferase